LPGNLHTERDPVVVPQSKPFRPGKTPGSGERGSAPLEPSAANSDDNATLASLKELVAAGDHRLDPMLEMIADAARNLTGASGAAIAMWKDGAMMCRARSGDTAPPLGARLSAETGISGECLRSEKIQNCADTESDPLVDIEVCRSLGLRSIAVLPVQGWRGINGILEVFSTQPAAFSEQHIALLQQLASLAERARASQPHGASSSPSKASSAVVKPQPGGLLPASDRVGDVALAFVGTRSRPVVSGVIGLAAISLVALVIWLGWRGADGGDGRAQAATSAPISIADVNRAAVHFPDSFPDRRPLAVDKSTPVKPAHDNDPVWKPDPGGETLFSSTGKPSAGSPVKFASKVEALPVKKSQKDRAPLLADVADKVAGEANPPNHHTDSESGSPVQSSSAAAASASQPTLSQSTTTSAASDEVLTAKASLPETSAQPPVSVSQGVSGGQLIRRVAPVYPAQALRSHVEGTVVLAAVIMEDGSVRSVKVVQGPATLAQSAVEAVKLWRYQPFELDGKPVKNEITISVDFKFPTDTASR
jgi:TonB family protein